MKQIIPLQTSSAVERHAARVRRAMDAVTQREDKAHPFVPVLEFKKMGFVRLLYGMPSLDEYQLQDTLTMGQCEFGKQGQPRYTLYFHLTHDDDTDRMAYEYYIEDPQHTRDEVLKPKWVKDFKDIVRAHDAHKQSGDAFGPSPAFQYGSFTEHFPHEIPVKKPLESAKVLPFRRDR